MIEKMIDEEVYQVTLNEDDTSNEIFIIDKIISNADGMNHRYYCLVYNKNTSECDLFRIKSIGTFLENISAYKMKIAESQNLIDYVDRLCESFIENKFFTNILEDDHRSINEFLHSKQEYLKLLSFIANFKLKNNYDIIELTDSSDSEYFTRNRAE